MRRFPIMPAKSLKKHNFPIEEPQILPNVKIEIQKTSDD